MFKLMSVVAIALLLVRSNGNSLDQQVAAAVDSLVSGNSGSASNSYVTSNTYNPQNNYPPAYAVPYISYGNSWPYYNGNNNGNGPYNDIYNWNYNMPIPALSQPYVNNGNCYYIFNTAMVYDMSTYAERIATPSEQSIMNQCYSNPYAYVPCLCASC
ncbi:hypothetical protein QR680_010395 [Steinernema hermaphroditum]|uniref:Uncharacterized protein n=1 Tax=Steinernema hermaphroditum TaxID=289476 RepID=A0AA39MB52_9BILA|nr:hypothetical protein QR680_010395 [Steinernema hermaphroditum]